jgi:K(+)-stimulated pyrophosphate-energized sodium pump
MDIESSTYLLLVIGSAVLALIFAFIKSRWVNRQDPGNERMQEIGLAVREGAMAFLSREYKVLAIFVAVIAVLLFVGYKMQSGEVGADGSTGMSSGEEWIAISFLAGAFCSALAGYFGMRVATAANIRTTQAARTGLAQALAVAFNGGAVMGMSVVGLGILGLGVLCAAFGWAVLSSDNPSTAELSIMITKVSGFSMGASCIALFARVGGGIYTKAADVGADLVGKVEAGIPEDDPRNPATIADNVGDNVGDVAGMGADLFESFVGSIIAAMVLAATLFDSMNVELAILPLVLAGGGIIASIIGTFFVKTKEGGNPQTALNIGTFGAAFLMTAFTFGLCWMLLGDSAPKFIGTEKTIMWWQISVACVAGLIAGAAVGLLTEYYTGESAKPTQSIVKASDTGAATNIIAGLGVGMQSTALPIVAIGAGILVAYHFAGLYGIAIAGLGMLATTGVQLAVDAYGPIADNAGGCAEMAGLPPEVRERTDKLDAVGNTTAAIGKGFAIGSAALTALALFAAFQQKAGITTIDVADPWVMTGLLFGAMLPFLFSSFAMKAVGNAAFDMIEEVRRQFREIPGLREGKEGVRADYARCVDISTTAAIKQMVLPGFLAIVVPVFFGYVLGQKEMLAGILAGVTSSGVVLAIFMSNAGGAWDNAKKFVEGRKTEGKGSEAHMAAVVGDTVGDPFKDTAGPSINILIKLMSVISLVLAPLM